jgi:hypothetical protein
MAYPSHRGPILIDSLLLRQIVQADYTLGNLNEEDTYHISVIRSKLTRNIAGTFNQLCDELSAALEDYIPTDNEGM